MNSVLPVDLDKALKGSGFPFQTAIREVIQRHPGYSIHVSEYPWKNAEGETGFLDLIALHRDLILAVECKKTTQKSYVFLLPGLERGEDLAVCACLWVARFDDEKKPAVYWAELDVEPSCSSSEFCIVSGAKNNNDRMLEYDAAQLVNAADVFTWDFRETRKLTLNPPYPVIPVIVTNAELYRARYNASDVSLSSGQFQNLPDLLSVPWIRFYKSLSSGHGFDLGLRTVFVVNASRLGEFLDKLKAGEVKPGGRCEHIHRGAWLSKS